MASQHKSVALTITPDARAIERARVELAGVSNGLNKAIAGAINKTLRSGKTEVVRGLASVLTAKPSAIRKSQGGNERITLIKAAPNKLEGFIKILTRPIALINFKFKEVRKKRKHRKYGTSYPGEGVSTQVFQNGPIYNWRHSFVAVGKSGNRHIFIRRYAGGAVGTERGRFPIDSRQGPSLWKVFKLHPKLHNQVKDRLQEDFEKELASQIDRFLKRSKK